MRCVDGAAGSSPRRMEDLFANVDTGVFLCFNSRGAKMRRGDYFRMRDESAAGESWDGGSVEDVDTSTADMAAF
jgi:hypothetical protein